MRRAIFHLCVCSMLSVGTPLLADAPLPVSASVGRVRVLSGTAQVVRGTDVLPARLGLSLQEGDLLQTGADGRLGVTLADDTRLTLGPASALRVDALQYAPAEGRLALALKVVKGVAAYVSGRIAKLAPDAVRLETPAAIVGVRGTTLVIQVAEP